MTEFPLQIQQLILLPLILASERHQRRRLVHVPQTLHKLLGVLVNHLDELLSHLHQLPSDRLLPLVHDRGVASVLLDALHDQVPDCVEVGHVFLSLV